MESLSTSRINLGKMLMWLGILAWAPYGYMQISGKEVSLLPFLAIHLTGVIGGLWVKKRQKVSPPPLNSSKKRSLLIGNILIMLGILVWAPYLYLQRIGGLDVEIAPYVFAHLSGILSGIFIRSGILDKLLQRFLKNSKRIKIEQISIE